MVVEEVLVPRLVKLTDPMEQIMLGFAEIGFPQCVGAVDGCHIPIQNPADSNGEYINRKKFASIVLMAICDHRGRFYAAEAGESGKSHDAYIFNGCHFTHAIDRGAFFPATPSLVVDGVAVPPLVLGDGAFPMRTSTHLSKRRRKGSKPSLRDCVSLLTRMDRRLSRLKDEVAEGESGGSSEDRLCIVTSEEEDTTSRNPPTSEPSAVVIVSSAAPGSSSSSQ
ncbi:uncharacterized protein LOC125440201 isoform X2 [Sphaerodactylus townsendi]|uniref:uncharacterized protein LOC125440201 isoform X2 n=2 Tax=Sphaerodactylus townsendi TaxID=933632 RepID=UPI002025FFF4|nr:uncharacterized protein LOC125440201 isoform X2 [Sphaerodactylus townsendi]